jgi:hypothetical protein
MTNRTFRMSELEHGWIMQLVDMFLLKWVCFGDLPHVYTSEDDEKLSPIILCLPCCFLLDFPSKIGAVWLLPKVDS